jgi:acyl carrier protein
MQRELVERRLDAVFQDVFDDPSLTVRDDMTAADVDGWESLTHINLVVAVEKEFHVRFTTAEVRNLKNVGDFIALIGRKAV